MLLLIVKGRMSPLENYLDEELPKATINGF